MNYPPAVVTARSMDEAKVIFDFVRERKDFPQPMRRSAQEYYQIYKDNTCFVIADKDHGFSYCCRQFFEQYMSKKFHDIDPNLYLCTFDEYLSYIGEKCDIPVDVSDYL